MRTSSAARGRSAVDFIKEQYVCFDLFLPNYKKIKSKKQSNERRKGGRGELDISNQSVRLWAPANIAKGITSRHIRILIKRGGEGTAEGRK